MAARPGAFVKNLEDLDGTSDGSEWKKACSQRPPRLHGPGLSKSSGWPRRKRLRMPSHLPISMGFFPLRLATALPFSAPTPPPSPIVSYQSIKERLILINYDEGVKKLNPLL